MDVVNLILIKYVIFRRNMTVMTLLVSVTTLFVIMLGKYAPNLLG